MIRRVEDGAHGFGVDLRDVLHVIPADAEMGALSVAACGLEQNWVGMGMSTEDGARVCGACFAAHGIPTHDVTVTLCGPEPVVLPDLPG